MRKPTPEKIAAAAHNASVRAMSMPPRVCYLNRQVINNPVCQITVDTSMCGTAGRANVDALTSDKDSVTCKMCLDLFAIENLEKVAGKKKTPTKRKKP